MLQTQTCVSVCCDQCGDGPYTPDPDDLGSLGTDVGVILR